MVRGKSKLERKIKEGITKVDYKKDNQGTYIPYCSYHMHPGIINPEVADICEERKCFHYMRFYI